MRADTSSKLRFADIASWDVTATHDPDGVVRVRPSTQLGPYPKKLTDVLDHWAERAPSRVFLAKRNRSGDWRTIDYGTFRTLARNAGQALLGLGLAPERPIAILSGNDLEHAILGMAAMYAGIPYAPISPMYSSPVTGFGKLRHIFELLNPGLIFAADGKAVEQAISTTAPKDAPLVFTTNPLSDRNSIPFDALAATAAGEALERASSAVAADTVAKILFTSGSTGVPKGVCNTHRMLCSNQEMIATVFRFLRNTPPVICDWLPWNHTFGGNHNLGIVLYNGGTLYIDDGKPVGDLFQETVRNLREIAPTVYFNVPKGYECLADHLRRDKELRRNFFSRLEIMYYAAAGLSQHVWDSLDELAVETCGERIVMLTGLGATETAPFALCASKESARSGVVGLPAPGVELKLVPNEGKLEARLRGPNITPGFWRQPDLTQSAFDEEGFYRLGDALRFQDATDISKGFLFDGRIAEDFKLSSGTWVSVGPLRARFILHAAPYVKDIVLAGPDRGDLTALIFPDMDRYRDLLKNGEARTTFERLLQSFAAGATGSANRIERAIIVEDAPSAAAGEITDKGSISQHAVLSHRKELVEQMYLSPIPANAIRSEGSST